MSQINVYLLGVYVWLWLWLRITACGSSQPGSPGKHSLGNDHSHPARDINLGTSQNSHILLTRKISDFASPINNTYGILDLIEIEDLGIATFSGVALSSLR